MFSYNGDIKEEVLTKPRWVTELKLPELKAELQAIAKKVAPLREEPYLLPSSDQKGQNQVLSNYNNNENPFKLSPTEHQNFLIAINVLLQIVDSIENRKLAPTTPPRLLEEMGDADGDPLWNFYISFINVDGSKAE